MSVEPQCAPVPANESERLETLRGYHVLDTLPEPEFDALTRLAGYIIGAPIALISFVDADRQWFKSRLGLQDTETPRDISFCQHAIMGQEIFEVVDATEDERFAENPLLEALDLRFYAGSPLTTPKGHNVGTLCVIDHVARRLTQEQRDALDTLSRAVVAQLELRAQKRVLIERNEELATFAHIVSHDLKAPLRGIGNLTSFIRQDCQVQTESPLERYLDRINLQTERMRSLIEGILRYAKAGTRSIDVMPIDVRPLITEVVEDISPCESFTVEIIAPSDPVNVDSVLVRQVLQNLLSNAFRHHGGETGTITIDVKVLDGELRIQVTDDGPGIEAHHHERIFEMFRSVRPDADGDLSGVGLAIVKKLVDTVGGSINLESEVGRGSCFTVRIPTH